MSYDTIVHEALDPPEARVVDKPRKKTGLRTPGWFFQRRSAAAITLTLALLSMLGTVTWTVASFSSSQFAPVTEDADNATALPSAPRELVSPIDGQP